MCETGRHYNCQRCHKQVVICRHCDNGQIYCSKECSETARTASARAAEARYQQTRQGKLNHAERQRHYRANQKLETKKVTDQGSADEVTHDVISPSTTEVNEVDVVPKGPKLYCHFCHKPISEFLRNDFLVPSERYRASPVAKIT